MQYAIGLNRAVAYAVRRVLSLKHGINKGVRIIVHQQRDTEAEEDVVPQEPPFTISVKTADYLVKIAEIVTRLEYGTNFHRDVKLHRKNRVRSVYSSLAIEGSTLSLDEVTDVIEGKLVAGKQTEIKEVKNAYEAYDKVMAFDPYSVKDFLKAHKLMTDGLVEESGAFRKGDVGIFDAGRIVHIGARPQFVPQLIEELFSWAREANLHPVLKSAIVHCEIETIHPFADGNGRMGRLWQTLVLAKWNSIFAWIPMESLVYEKRPQYYVALHNAQVNNDAEEFIEFSLSTILETVEAQAKLQEVQRTGKLPEKSADFRQKKSAEKIGRKSRNNKLAIIEYLSENPFAKTTDIAGYIGIGRSRTGDFLRELIQEGVVVAQGKTRNRTYRLKEGTSNQ